MTWGLLHAVSAWGRYMYRSAQVANDSLHPFKTEQGIQQMHCREKTYEKEMIQTCKYIRSWRDARNLKHKKCQGGKKPLKFRHNVFKWKPSCNLKSLQNGKHTVTQLKRNQVSSWETCPKALMHKQVQSSKQNVPGHWCTWLLEPEQSNSLHLLGLLLAARRIPDVTEKAARKCWFLGETPRAASPREQLE